MRTGTRTVRAFSLMTSPPAMICGRCSRTDSRTFSSCRSQSRAPRENRSYHFARPSALFSLSLMARPSFRCSGCALLLREESRDVAQRFLGAVLVVAVFLHQAFLHHRDLLTCIVVGPRRRGHEAQHVPALLEQVLLDRLAHARMAHKLELLPGLERHHRLAHDLLAEGKLAGIGHLDLLLHRSQEPLVRRP